MSALVCSGELYKLGGGALSRHQRRYFELRDNGALTYYEKPHGEEKGVIYVEGAKVVDRGTYQGKLCFSIEGVNLAKGVKEYYLFTDDAASKWMWYQSIQRLTKRYDFLNEGTASGTRSAAAGPDSRVLASPVYAACIAGVVANQTCADCGAPHPTWAVGRPFGVFVCIECIGVHRSVHAPLCKEVELDKWTEEEIAYVKEGRGNDVVNAELEYHVPDGTCKPNQWSSRSTREAYIHRKYDKSFTREACGPEAVPKPPIRDDAVAADLQAEQNAFGAPPKYVGVAFLVLEETNGYAYNGSVAVLTNGFQEVRSSPGAKVDSATTRWNVPLQIGVDIVRRPLYVTLYEGDGKIAATAELILSEVAGLESASASGEAASVSVPLTGKSISERAFLHAKVSFTKLT